MSSSRVFSSFSLTTGKVPVGTEDFVTRYRKEIEETSDLGRKLKAMERQHKLELREAHEKGRHEGDAAATRLGQQRLQEFETQFRQVIEELLKYRDTVYLQARQQLFDFAFHLANTITAARGDAEEKTVLDTIDRCLKEILDKSRLRIRIHPSQVEYVQSHIEDLANLGTINSVITVESDPRVSAGGCIIETDSGSADATLGSQMEQLRQHLQNLES